MASQKNIGEQIGDAIQEAIADQDFSKLQDTVKQGIDFAAKSINASLAQAAQANRENREQMERRQREYAARQRAEEERRRQRELVRSTRYASSSGLKVSGYAMAIGGGFLAVSLATSALVTLTGTLFGGSLLLGSASVALLAFCAGSTGLAIFGGTRIGLSMRYATYQQIIGTRDSCSIAELSQRSGRAPKRVIKDLDKMIARGLFVQGRLSADQSTFFVTNAAYERYQTERQAATERQRQEAIERQAAKTAADGTPISPEAQAILDKGYTYIQQIRKSNEGIPGAEVSAKIDQIELLVDSIFKRAKEHPEVIGDLQQLMDYYLPVTVKLLGAYEDLDSQPIQSEQIVRSKREIEDTLDTLNTAFEKLLDSIFKDMAWDVSTDISVLHTVLAQEGLTEDPFEKTSGGQT